MHHSHGGRRLTHHPANHGLWLTPERRIKPAYSTGAVPLDAMHAVGRDHEARPRCGDLVLARVDEVGHHKRLELRNGRRAHLFEGDHLIVCYGNRYAPAEFEAEVPWDFGPCDLVAAGGIASRMLAMHANVNEP